MDKIVIDLEEVLERVQDDKELLLELFDIFTNDYNAKMQVLKAAIANNDFEIIKDVIHSIKGAAGNISAKKVHETCTAIEHVALGKDLAGVSALIPTLEKHYQDLQLRMVEIKKEFGATG